MDPTTAPAGGDRAAGRDGAAGPATGGGPVQVIRLTGRGPLRAGPVIAFLGARAVPGLEEAGPGWFRRRVPPGWLELAVPTGKLGPADGAAPPGGAPPTGSRPPTGAAPTADDTAGLAAPARDDGGELELRLGIRSAFEGGALLAAARRVADLDTDLEPVAAHLAAADAELAARLRTTPLGRVPGAFDPFEVAVRAVVGQQVSVAAARTLLGRLVSLVTGHGGPFDRFPPAALVAATPLDELGMPGRRRATISALARAVAEGSVQLGPGVDAEVRREQLLALPGIGPWTAGYIDLRLGDPDGWPSGDLVLRQSLGVSAAELDRRAERWRPWRAYAALLLWHTAGGPGPPAPGPGRPEVG